MKNQDPAWKEFLLVEVASLCEIISLLGKHRKCRKLKKNENPKNRIEIGKERAAGTNCKCKGNEAVGS